MPGEQHDFGRVDYLDAEAIGPPGQRRFRVTAVTDDRSASLWIEKEQLAALGAAMEQQLVRSSRSRASGRPATDDDALSLPLNPSVDFRVSQLALGYDEDRSLFVLQAYSREAEDQNEAAFSCAADHEQARRLIRRIGRLMSSGRPVCPLCGATIDGPHRCPRSNGHAEVVLR